MHRTYMPVGVDNVLLDIIVHNNVPRRHIGIRVFGCGTFAATDEVIEYLLLYVYTLIRKYIRDICIICDHWLKFVEQQCSRRYSTTGSKSVSLFWVLVGKVRARKNSSY